MIQVSIVTGFLGAGKTTLIGRLLRDPALSRTAVIVNELGEIGLDHHLIARSDENLLTLTTGCLCCAVRGDLIETLIDLWQRRADGTAEYDRVLIETSGLADPAPILHALMTDAAIAATHRVDTVVALVDCAHGAIALAAHPEARRQVALADVLALSKTDIVAVADSLLAHLVTLNQTAIHTTSPALSAEDLFVSADMAARAKRLLHLPDRPAGSPFSQARHGDGVESFVLERAAPLPALALTLLLQALTEHAGGRLLRVKGLIGVEEMPGRPALIQGVRHVFSVPEFLDRWPSEDTSTRIVFIGQGLPRYFPARLLAAIEEEVRETLGGYRQTSA